MSLVGGVVEVCIGALSIENPVTPDPLTELVQHLHGESYCQVLMDFFVEKRACNSATAIEMQSSGTSATGPLWRRWHVTLISPWYIYQNAELRNFALLFYC